MDDDDDGLDNIIQVELAPTLFTINYFKVFKKQYYYYYYCLLRVVAVTESSTSTTTMGVKSDLATFFTSYVSCKVIYFLEFAFLSCFLPYITIYLKVGAMMEPWYIGILTSLIPFMSFIFTPLWTLVTDKYNNHRVVLIVSCLMTGLFLGLLLLVGSNVIGVFFATLCYAIAASPISALIDFLVIQKLDTDRQMYGQQRLWGAISWGIISFTTGYLIDIFENIHLIIYCYILWMLVFVTVVFFLNFKSTTAKLFQQIKNLEVIDSSKNLLNLLSTNIHSSISNNNSANSSNSDLSTIGSGVSTPNMNQEEEYGHHRLSPTSSSSSTSSLSSAFEEGGGEDRRPQMVVEITTATMMEDSDMTKKQQKRSLLEESEKMDMEDIDILDGADESGLTGESDNNKVSMRVVLKGVIHNTPFMLFLFAIMISGMAQTIISNFLFLFLKDHLQASTILLGATLPFTVIMELPFFFFGKVLLERIGVKWMIAIGHIAFIVRLVAYNIFTIPGISPWWVMPIETLHGVAFAAIWTAGIEYSSLMAEKGYQATYQGIFASINGGLGSGLGSIIGGFIYQHIGPFALWRFAACATTMSLVIFLITSIYFNPDKISKKFQHVEGSSTFDQEAEEDNIQLEPYQTRGEGGVHDNQHDDEELKV
ncbi:hypothetical protein DFA_11590 [Cavenderia fasciculata]|uniref:Major facilitator superfamily (MFS) profile domain-containing protein n=1 Tax=Cavenderia fasciculata TaxID=261658 RepID=F4QDN2_CACFS|nr:uncharacterized protein DFA_11590 [Cavenderia fasciculata]EGG13829.1 hypothetical protein DFA_11590 [Cavenderia fasciculata]|eukprot:XP_004350537.1 hypothetical protein DFA_11590 [Cavenderia fasciculata]